MIDLCQLNPLECLNNGQCVVNISLNMTYCQCDPCHIGINCKLDIWKQTQFDTAYVYMIIFFTELCLSVLNNGLSLELFVRSKQIRQTNCGIYLIVYSVLSIVSSILLVVDATVAYYPNQLTHNGNQPDIFHCYVSKISYNMLVYLCIWFSSCITMERGLVLFFDRIFTASRWRSLVTIIVIFAIAGGSTTPLFLYKCDWDDIPKLQSLRAFCIEFYLVTSISIYILSTVLISFSFVRRIRSYGMKKGPFMKRFLKILYSHLFIFAPPIAYIICYIPYWILYYTRNSDHSYFQCGISTAEYIVKVLVDILQGVPFAITWLLFVYPSNIYMKDFYVKTWLGQRLVKITVLLKLCCFKKTSPHQSTRAHSDIDMIMEIYTVQTDN